MITYIVTIIHVLTCFFLIVMVLLQQGKGADLGATFGGGSNTLFGASGADNLLIKITTGLALFFMSTSIILTVSGKRVSSLSTSSLDLQDSKPVESSPLNTVPAANVPVTNNPTDIKTINVDAVNPEKKVESPLQQNTTTAPVVTTEVVPPASTNTVVPEPVVNNEVKPVTPPAPVQ